MVSCERRVLDLEFTSPYALHLPARLTERAARDGHVVRTIHEPTTDEPFEAQLLAFHGSNLP